MWRRCGNVSCVRLEARVASLPQLRRRHDAPKPLSNLCAVCRRRSPVESVFHGCCFGLQSHVTRIGRVLASRLAWRHADYIVKMVSKDGVVELPFVELGKVAAPVAAGGAMEVESA